MKDNTLLFEVKGQYIVRLDSIEPVAKCRNLYKAQFQFKTDEWTGTKTALFVQGEYSKSAILDENGVCEIPWEFFDADSTTFGYVSVYCGDLVTANRVVVDIVKSGYQDSDASVPPSPDVYQQLMKLAEDTKEIAQSVRDDADNCVFDGEEGYSPKVSLTEELDGVTVTVQNKDGQQSAKVKNGKDGKGYEHSEEFTKLAEQVRQDKESVEQTVQGFEQTTQQAVENVNTAKTQGVDAINTAKEESVKAVVDKGTEQTGNVTAEGEKQVQAVQAKGQEVINSIPSDYTTQMQSKLDKQQGVEHAGKTLVIGEDGNVVPGEPTQQIKVDKTLAQEGQAADAKATGDNFLKYAIKDKAQGETISLTDSADEKLLDFKLYGKSTQGYSNSLVQNELESGTISVIDGNNATSMFRVRTKSYITLRKGLYIIKCEGIKQGNVIIYGKDKTFKSSLYKEHRPLPFILELDEDSRIRIVVSKGTEEEKLGIYPSDIKSIDVIQKVEGKNLFNPDEIDTTRHILADLSGFSSVDTANYNLSNLISVKPGEFISKSGGTGSSVVAFLNENKEFLQGVSLTDNNRVLVPDGASYFCSNIAVANMQNKIQFEKNVIKPTEYEPFTNGKKTPSMKYPIEVEHTGIKSKNLFDISNFPLEHDEESIVIKPTDISAKIIDGSALEEHTEYVIWCEKYENTQPDNTNTPLVEIVYTDGTKSEKYLNVLSTGSWLSVDVAKTVDYIWIRNPSKVGVKIYGLQIEKGTYATEFYPYNQYENILVTKLNGKNLVPVDIKYIGRNGNNPSVVEYDNKTHRYILKTKTGTFNQISMNIYLFLPKGTYTIKRGIIIDGVDVTSRARGFDVFDYGVGQYVKHGVLGMKQTFTLAKSSYVSINIGGYTDGKSVKEAILYDVQLECGDSSTSYEPYKESQTVKIDLDTPLRGIGKYRDILTKDGITRNIGVAKLVDYLGASIEGSFGNRYIFSIIPNALLKYDKNRVLSNTGFDNIAIHEKSILISCSDEDTIETVREKIKDVSVCYTLANPTFEPFENSLSELKTNHQNTVISTDVDIEMEVEYVCDTKTYIDNKFKELQQATISTNLEMLERRYEVIL